MMWRGEKDCEEFSEVKTEVCSLVSPQDKEKQSRAEKNNSEGQRM